MSFVKVRPSIMDLVMPRGERLHAEVASDPEDLAYGLKGRQFLRADCGMLFVYLYTGYHKFTTQGMLITLDMVWMDRTGKIVEIVRDARPDGLYGGSVQSAYGLEIGAGMAGRGFVNSFDLKIGQIIGGLDG
jgi:uncharacterized protein